jgi:hypothetical protein
MLNPVSVPIAPGSTGTCAVRVRNTGVVVDQFTVTVLGDAAGWTTITPPVLSLFPGTDGTVELRFSPPRTATHAAGPMVFGVRVIPTEDSDGSVVEEGSIDLQPFTEIVAKLTPRTSEAKRSARHEVSVDNKGNTTIEAEVGASDPDEQLAFEVKPIILTVAPGDTGRASVKVGARKGFARGAQKHRPFTVTVSPGPAQPVTRLEGMLIQHAGLPRLLFPAIAALCAIALIAFVAPKMLNKEPGSGGGLFDLTAKNAPTTTIDEEAAAAAQDAKDAADAKAAADAELAANGKDPSEVASGGGAAAAAAAGGAAAPSAGGAATPSGGGSPGVTSPGAAPAAAPSGSSGTPSGSPGTTAAPGSPGTTAAPGAPGTTAPPSSPPTTRAPSAKNFLGNWTSGFDFMTVSFPSKTTISVSVNPKGGGFTCSGSISDANDNSFTATSCTDGPVRTFNYLSDSDQVQILTPPPSGTRCPVRGCVPSSTLWDRSR